MKLNNFRGDLTDISAKKEALVTARAAHITSHGLFQDPVHSACVSKLI